MSYLCVTVSYYERYDFIMDLRDASHARSLARNELFYATERDLREKNRHLRAENARLRALVERLGGGHLHASASESESES